MVETRISAKVYLSSDFSVPKSSAPTSIADISPPVCALLLSVRNAAKWKPAPHWVPVWSLHLDIDRKEAAAAMILAELKEWIVLGGAPPHSVRITGKGISVLDG